MDIRAKGVVSGVAYNKDNGNSIVNRELEKGNNNHVKIPNKSITLKLNDNENSIFARKDQLKKGAMKIMMDAFAGEQKIDQRVGKHLDKVSELTKEANESSREIKRLQELQNDLKSDYNIADDSQEQKDLELLKKAYDYKKGISFQSLTKDEIEYLDKMGPTTEYQEASMEYYKMDVEFRGRMVKANDAIANENRTIGAIELARVQIHPIVDAKVEADKILEAASKEVTQGLMDEIRDRIDDNIEENEEKADEIKEEKLDSREKIEKDIIHNESEERTEEKLTNKLNGSDQIREPEIDWNNAHKKIKKLIKAQKLLADDLKGIEINEEL